MHIGYILAGALLGLTLLGVAAPMAMTMFQSHGPVDWHMHGTRLVEPHSEPMEEHCHEEMHCYNCEHTHDMIQERDRLMEHERNCDETHEVNTTTISGVVESISTDGYMVIQTENGEVTIQFRGIWSDGETTIPYYQLAEQITQGETIIITGFYKCFNDEFKATQITIGTTTYMLESGHH